jgi:hypothetical protein
MTKEASFYSIFGNLHEVAATLPEGTQISANADKTTKTIEIAQAIRLIQQLKNLKYFSKDKSFDSHPIYFNPEIGTIMPQNAIVMVSHYPFGSKRCLRASFMDFNKDDCARTVHVTTNWAYGWNAPKASTFAQFHCYELMTVVEDGGIAKLAKIYLTANDYMPYDYATGSYDFKPEVAAGEAGGITQKI